MKALKSAMGGGRKKKSSRVTGGAGRMGEDEDDEEDDYDEDPTPSRAGRFNLGRAPRQEVSMPPEFANQTLTLNSPTRVQTLPGRGDLMQLLATFYPTEKKDLKEQDAVRILVRNLVEKKASNHRFPLDWLSTVAKRKKPKSVKEDEVRQMNAMEDLYYAIQREGTLNGMLGSTGMRLDGNGLLKEGSYRTFVFVLTILLPRFGFRLHCCRTNLKLNLLQIFILRGAPPWRRCADSFSGSRPRRPQRPQRGADWRFHEPAARGCRAAPRGGGAR